MSAMGLTRQQHDCLSFISQRVRESGIAPSFDDMKDAMGIKSKSGVHRLVSALEERGFIRRMEKRARAIEVLRLPENLAANQRPPVSREQIRRGARAQRSPIAVGSGVAVPLVGRIAAYAPVEALQNKIGEVMVNSGLLGRGLHYALEVEGDSMINAGILDGDTVIIQEADSANSGEIIVALIDRSQATLKRYRRRGDHIALEAANPAYTTHLYSPGRVEIQGRLVGLVRRY